VIICRFQVNLILRIKRGEVVKKDLIPSHLRVFVVHQFDFQHGKVPLCIFRRSDLTRDGVAGSKVEPSDLRRGDVDSSGPGK